MFEIQSVEFDWLQEPSLQRLFSLLNVEGEEVRVVGGAVRNSLIGVPIRDIDCATTATPPRMVELAERAGIKTIPTGIEHGTITFVIDGKSFEVTSLRADVETDGRHAVVAFGRDWDLDARRRDFTMNALYVDTNGTLYDPTGLGCEDAQARHVRFIGDASRRIEEDYLRILRFFRFFAQYGASYSKADYQACICEQNGLQQLSAERVGAEMVKLVRGAYAPEALTLMFEGGLLPSVVGGVARLGRYKRLTDLCASLGVTVRLPLLLVALAVEVREEAVQLSRHWRLPNKLRDAMILLCDNVDQVSGCSISDLKVNSYRFEKNVAIDLVLLSLANRRLDCDLDQLLADFSLLESWDPPVFPLSGRDLIAVGIKPGPHMGAAIRQLEESWIESDFQLSSDDLLSLSKAI